MDAWALQGREHLLERRMDARVRIAGPVTVPPLQYLAPIGAMPRSTSPTMTIARPSFVTSASEEAAMFCEPGTRSFAKADASRTSMMRTFHG